MVTIKEVAKAANVSVATISRALNDDRNVSETTKKHVMAVIDELGYTPNLLGRNLRISRTKRILVLVPDSANPFYSEVFRGIDGVAEQADFLVMIATSNGELAREKMYIDQVLNKSYDGLIMASSKLNAQELSALAKRAPIVMCCEYVEDADISSVTIDNRKAEFDAVSHLISKGHTRIGMITSDYSYSGRERTQGYIDAHIHHGLKVNEQYIITGGYNYSNGLESTSRLMNLSKPPTAIVTISDFLSLAASNFLSHSTRPDFNSVEIFGFDNTIIANIIQNHINTVAQPAYEIGKKSMKILLDKINDKPTENGIHYLDYSLIIKHD